MNHYLTKYQFLVSAPGFENKSLTINVKNNENKKINIILDSIGVSISYHDYQSMTTLLANFSIEYPEITSLYAYVYCLSIVLNYLNNLSFFKYWRKRSEEENMGFQNWFGV